MIRRASIILLVALCVATFVCFEPQPVRAAWAHTDEIICDGFEEVSDTAVSCTVSVGTVNNGNVIVVWVATDNVDTADGETTLHSSVTDSDSNTYTKACEFTNAQGAAAAGATVSVWFAKVGADLTSPDTVTANTSTAVTDKAIVGEEFTIGAGNVVSVEGTCQTLANDNADAGSQTISGLTSQQYLFVRGIAAESNAATSLTATTSYTFINGTTDGCTGTTGGGEASDMAVCGEFRILTATGDTSDPTLVDTTNDNASVYVALKEAAPAAITPAKKRVTIISRGKPRPGAVVVRE